MFRFFRRLFSKAWCFWPVMTTLCLCCGITGLAALVGVEVEFDEDATEQAVMRENQTATQDEIFRLATIETWTPTPTATDTPTATNTPTPSDTPTATNTPTDTLTPTRTPIPSDTSIPTNTLPPSETPIPTNTPRPTRTPQPTNTTAVESSSSEPEVIETRYINSSAGSVNLRSGPSTNARIVGGLLHQDEIEIIGTNSAGDWYEIIYRNDTAWVFASLTSANRPAAISAPPADSGSSGSSGGSSPATAPPAAVCSCSGDLYNCTNGSFNTRAQAQACFEYCMSTVGYDVHRLDNDNDGLICESGVR